MLSRLTYCDEYSSDEQERRNTMGLPNRDEVEGKLDQVKGKTKETAMQEYVDLVNKLKS